MISRKVLFGLLGMMIALTAFVVGFGQSSPMRQASTTETQYIEKNKTDCTLTQASLPRIAGLQMGATYDDVLSVYPEIADDAFFQKHLEADGSGLTNVRAQSLFDASGNDKPITVGLFFKDRILVVISNGSGPKKYKPVREAIAEYSKLLGVDYDQWTIFYRASAELKCVDFAFYANSDAAAKGNSMSVHSIPKETK